MNFHPHNDIIKLTVPQGFTAHVTLASFTEANVAKGTLLSTITDLGSFTFNTTLHIGKLMEALEQYSMPANLPAWKVDLLNKLDQPGQFSLNIEYAPIETVQIIGVDGHLQAWV